MCSSLLFALLLASSVYGNLYYGRAFGTATSWYQKDKGSSHHLEVSFGPMPGYPSFTANIDIRSRDGTSLFVSQLKSSQLAPILPLFQHRNGTGVAQLSSGIKYCGWLQASQFTQMTETAYVNLLVSLLRNSQYVYFFGQVYHDNDGTSGIHDIHRITNYPGDGALIAQDSQGNFFGVFAYFQNQQVC